MYYYVWPHYRWYTLQVVGGCGEAKQASGSHGDGGQLVADLVRQEWVRPKRPLGEVNDATALTKEPVNDAVAPVKVAECGGIYAVWPVI